MNVREYMTKHKLPFCPAKDEVWLANQIPILVRNFVKDFRAGRIKVDLSSPINDVVKKADINFCAYDWPRIILASANDSVGEFVEEDEPLDGQELARAIVQSRLKVALSEAVAALIETKRKIEEIVKLGGFELLKPSPNALSPEQEAAVATVLTKVLTLSWDNLPCVTLANLECTEGRSAPCVTLSWDRVKFILSTSLIAEWEYVSECGNYGNGGSWNIENDTNLPFPLKRQFPKQ